MDYFLLYFYLMPLLAGFILIQPFSWLVRKIARSLQVLDFADQPRKISRPPVPLWGGLALGSAWLVGLGIFTANGFILDGKISIYNIIGIFLATLLLLAGGALDDKFNLTPSRQILWSIAAVFVVLIFGIKVSFVTNPFGGILWLDRWQWSFFGLVFYPLAHFISFVWLLGMIYTTKFLDGLDGLVSGIATIGAFIIFIVSLFWDIPYSGTSVLALLTAGVFGGFLIWNFFPAKIFLGEAGSTLAGLWLGILAIISGGKIATALLIMGLPILDVVWVIIRRIFWERKSPVLADRKHLHFRLLDAGFSHRQAVLFLYFISALFGSLALFQNTLGKIALFLLLFVLMLIVGSFWVFLYKKKKNES